MSVGEIFYILFSDESHPRSSVWDGFNMEKKKCGNLCIYITLLDEVDHFKHSKTLLRVW